MEPVNQPIQTDPDAYAPPAVQTYSEAELADSIEALGMPEGSGQQTP